MDGMRADAKYKVVKDTIKTWILQGKVKPGEKIYSENELMKIFEVSRHTVRRAVGDLVHEGWLYREQGSGTYCTHRFKKMKHRGSEKNIGVITTYISEYIFPSIIRGIESYLSEKGYSLIVASTDNDIEKEKQCLENMLSRNIDGLIVEPTKSASDNPNLNYYLNLEQNEIPYLMINQFYQSISPPHIILDDEHGGYIATEHLIKLGHKRLLGLFKNDDLQGVNRMKGFFRAIREHHLPFFSDMVITYTTENRDEKTVDEVRALLRSPNRPTGIVCYNDEIALNVLHVTRELELKVPEDLSIVGYDDSHLTEATEVKLTSVTHPKMDMGIQAAKWIVSKIEDRGEETFSHSKVYTPELVIRHSTREMGEVVHTK